MYPTVQLLYANKNHLKKEKENEWAKLNKAIVF
jgi:hypothetical protein